MVREDVRGFVGSQCTFFSEDQQQEQQKNWQIYKKIPKTNKQKKNMQKTNAEKVQEVSKMETWTQNRTQRIFFFFSRGTDN